MELTRMERIRMPQARLIGRRYGDDDRINNLYAHLWEGKEAIYIREKLAAVPASHKAMLGYMRLNDVEFEYWIGKLCPPNTNPPEGLDCVDIPPREVAAATLRGNRDEAFTKAHHVAIDAMTERGWAGSDDGWFGECFAADLPADAEDSFEMEYHITIKES